MNENGDFDDQEGSILSLERYRGRVRDERFEQHSTIIHSTNLKMPWFFLRKLVLRQKARPKTGSRDKSLLKGAVLRPPEKHA